MKILLYSPIITPRLEYAVHLVLHYISGAEPVLTTSIEDFNNLNEARINYSNESIKGAIHVVPDSLLFETSIKNFTPETGKYAGMPILFPQAGASVFPFDPFAAAFWMATRYEEYLVFKADKHGRFPASQSLAFQKGFLDMPVVHFWADLLVQAIQKEFPDFILKKRSFEFHPTFDVDNAYAFLHKGFLRTAGAFVRDIVKGKFGTFKKRMQTLSGQKRDPYDSYDFIQSIHQSHGLHPIWFFLVGRNGPYDKNLSLQNPIFRNLIREIADSSEVGLHPSYGSNQKKDTFRREKASLEEVIGKPVLRSRQHFLKLHFPHTYNNLINCGINEDYTMGFHDLPGFRAGLCLPYPWFSLESNHEEPLIIIPFQLMDRTFTEYMGLNPTESLEKIKILIDRVKSVNGHFISLWHNEPAGNYNPEEWHELYKAMLHYLCSLLQ